MKVSLASPPLLCYRPFMRTPRPPLPAAAFSPSAAALLHKQGTGRPHPVVKIPVGGDSPDVQRATATPVAKYIQ